VEKRMDCQVVGRPEGKPCAHFDQDTLSCGLPPDGGPCIYQVESGITDEDLARREQVGIRPDVQQRIRGLQSNEELRKALDFDMLRTVDAAMLIVDQYNPTSPQFASARLDSGNDISRDIVHLAAMGVRIATMVGEAKAIANTIGRERHLMHGRKFFEVRKSHRAGLRGGRATDKSIEYEVRCDPEYIELTMSEVLIKERVETLSELYSSMIELVNTLKYEIIGLREEAKHG